MFSCLPNCAVLLFTFTLCIALSNQQWKWKLRAQAVLAELEEPASWSLREFSFPPPFLHTVALGSALPASSSCFCLLYWWPSEDHKEGQEGPLLPLPLPLSVPLSGHRGWGESLHPRKAGLGHHWHLGTGDSAVGSEALCLIWSSECISKKEGMSCVWSVQGP